MYEKRNHNYPTNLLFGVLYIATVPVNWLNGVVRFFHRKFQIDSGEATPLAGYSLIASNLLAGKSAVVDTVLNTTLHAGDAQGCISNLAGNIANIENLSDVARASGDVLVTAVNVDSIMQNMSALPLAIKTGNIVTKK